MNYNQITEDKVFSGFFSYGQLCINTLPLQRIQTIITALIYYTIIFRFLSLTRLGFLLPMQS